MGWIAVSTGSSLAPSRGSPPAPAPSGSPDPGPAGRTRPEGWCDGQMTQWEVQGLSTQTDLTAELRCFT